MEKPNNDNSILGTVFGIIGFLAAIAAGNNTGMSGGGIFVFAIIIGAIGYGIGKWVEAVVVQLIFIAAAIIMFLINASIRSFIFGIITGIFGG